MYILVQHQNQLWSGLKIVNIFVFCIHICMCDDAGYVCNIIRLLLFI
jgi:hypothetical protein